MKRVSLILMLGSAILISCGSKKSTTETPQKDTTRVPEKIDSLAFEVDTFHVIEKDKSCANNNPDCCYCDFYYEKIKSPLSAVHDSVNRFIDSLLAGSMDGLTFKNGKADIRQVALDFIKASSDPEYADMPTGWFWEVKVRLYRPVNEIFTVTISMGDFSGGAHPNYSYSIYNFFTGTGKQVHINDLFKDTASLNNMAVKYFKEQNELDPEIDLFEQGWFVSDEEFALNDNFDITTEAVRWEFNSYEMGPYAAGAPSVSIPMKDLEKYLKVKFTDVVIQ